MESEEHSARQPHGESQIRQIVHVLFKRKRLVATVFLVIFLGVAVGYLLSPRTYEASAVLVLRRDRGELVVSPASQALAGPALPRVELLQDLRSEAELLKRRSLIAHVVRAVGPATALRGSFEPPAVAGVNGRPAVNGAMEPAGVHAIRMMQEALSVARPVVAAPVALVQQFNAKEPLNDVEQAIEAVTNGVKVTPVEQSSVLRVTFEATDPRFARTVLDLMIAKYFEDYVRMRTSPGAVDFFLRERDSLRRDLREAEDSMQRLDATEGVSALAPQREMYLRTALDRETALETARSEIGELRERGRALREQLERLPATIRTVEELRANPVRDVVRGKVVELEAQRNKLLQLYQPDDRRVRDVEQEIELMRQRFLSEPTWEFAREAYGDNPVRGPLLVDLFNTEAQAIRTEVKARNLEREVSLATSRLRRLDHVVYERTRLERRIKTLEEAYLLYGRKYDEARIGAAMDESRLVNVTMAEPVQVTPERTVGGVGAWQAAVLGAVVGLVCGVGGAFTREYLDHTLDTPDSVRRRLRLPVLGAIEDHKG